MTLSSKELINPIQTAYSTSCPGKPIYSQCQTGATDIVTLENADLGVWPIVTIFF